MKRFGIIGYPLAHSFSPSYFAEKFLKEGIEDCSYEAFPIASIDALPLLLQSMPDLVGLNVTVPYKKPVLEFLHNSSDVIREMGACNCIAIKKGKFTGYNTDVVGFEKSLLPFIANRNVQALILGTGGSASAAAFVLKKIGIDFLFVTRKPFVSSNHLLYSQLTEEVMSTHNLIINTTPLGMFPEVNDCPDIPYHFLSGEHLLYDLIYNPSETLFLQKGKVNGAGIKNGLEMLQIQAEESWRIWVNCCHPERQIKSFQDR